ncbi:MAG: hypothetical protein NVS2B7_38780 [Herpetosiphon sp.]
MLATTTQIVEEECCEQAQLALVTVAPYSMTVVPVTERAELEKSSTPAVPVLVAARQRISSGDLRIELDDSGEFASIYDLRHEREVVAPAKTANQLVAYEDRPLRWDAWDIDLFYGEKPYPVREIVSWKVVEEGPLRAALRIVRKLGKSEIVQRICLWSHSRRIDMVTDVDWQERQTLLRALFPLNINTDRATCEIQFGAVERPTHRNTSWDSARFEVCAQRWVDLSEGGYGVALLNDSKYGHSLHDTTLGLSLLKGPIFPDPDADLGHHRFTYSLLPHQGDWREGEVVRRAYELNAPLRPYMPPTGSEQAGINRHQATGDRSFLRSEGDNILVETIKQAHNGAGVIIRLYEAHNMRGPGALVFDRPIVAVEEVDLLERTVSPLAHDGSRVAFTVRPFEIKTLRVRF